MTDLQKTIFISALMVVLTYLLCTFVALDLWWITGSETGNAMGRVVFGISLVVSLLGPVIQHLESK